MKNLSVFVTPRLVLAATFAGTSVLNYSFGLVMSWLLVPGDFGLLAFMQTIILIVGIILETGVPWSLAKTLIDAPGTRHPALIRGAMAMNVGLACAAGVAILGLFASGVIRSGLETWSIAGLTMITLPCIGILAVARGAAQGVHRFGVLAGMQITEMAVKFVISLMLVRLGLGVDGAAAGFLIGAAAAAAAGVVFLTASLGVHARGSWETATLRVLGPMFGGLIGIALLLNLDLLAVKLLAGDDRAAAGIYQAGIILANAPYFLVASALVPVAFAQFAHCRTLAATAPTLGKMVTFAAVLVIPLELLLALTPETALHLLFPQAFAAGADAVRLRAIGTSLVILVAILTSAFQATGRGWTPAFLLLGAVAAEMLCLPVVVPSGGSVGAAAAFVVVGSVALAGLGTIYLRELPVTSRNAAGSWAFRYGVTLALGITMVAAVDRLTGATIPSIMIGSLVYAFVALLLRIIELPPAAARMVERPG
jgi:O-antigen/teichoic acid export membrane protein